MKEKYTVIVIHAYDQLLPDGRLSNSTELQIIDDDCERAIKTAKKYLGRKYKRSNFRIATIIEKYREVVGDLN